MSLINQMLRDLDRQRGAESRPRLQAVDGAVQPVNRDGGLPRWLIGLTLFAVLALAGGLYWLQRGSMAQTPAVTLAVEPAAGVPAPEPTTERVGPNRSIASVPMEQPEKPELAAAEEPAASQASVVQVEPTPKRSAKESQEVPLKHGDDRRDSRPERLALASQPGLNEMRRIQPVGSTGTTRKQSEAVAPESNKKPRPAARPEPIKQPKRPVTSPYQQAKRAYQRGDLGEAEQLLSEQVKAYPGHLGSRLLLAQILMRGGRTTEAAGLLDQGLAHSPGAGALAVLRARLWLDQGERGKALALLEDTRRAGDRSLAVVELLAPLYQQNGDFAAAQAAYGELVQQKPGSSSAWAGLGISSDALEEGEAAVAAYQRALQLGGLPAAVQNYIQQRLAVRQGSKS